MLKVELTFHAKFKTRKELVSERFYILDMYMEPGGVLNLTISPDEMWFAEILEDLEPKEKNISWWYCRDDDDSIQSIHLTVLPQALLGFNAIKGNL